MIIDKKIFEPGVSFLNKTHHIPKKEIYTYAKKINKIKNTPVAPSFGKKVIHMLTSLFHKIEIKFLIRNIKNNKLSSVVDINKHNNFFNDVDNEESKKSDGSCSINSNSEGCFSQDEIKNKNLEAIKNIIYHANDKFDFYSFCDYLTEIKRAKDFFSSLNDVAGGECSDSKLIVDLLNKIAINRIKAIDDKSIKNVFKLVSLKFDFENVNLNKKYDFMHNFSSLKERDKFIKSINLLLISIDEGQVLKKFDNNIKNEMENKLSIIMMIVLGKNTDGEYSFDSLKQEWNEKYISNNYNAIKRNKIINTDIQEKTNLANSIEIEETIEIPKPLSKKDFNTRYIGIDDFDIGDYKLTLRREDDCIKGIDKYDDLDLQWDDEFTNINNIVDDKEQQEQSEKEERINDVLMERIKQLSLGLNSDEKFNKINNALELIMLDIDEYSAEAVSPLDLDKELKFSPNNYQLDFDTKENASEISEEDKNNKKL
ncbi:hypothetical protein [Proteus sp. STS61-E]|uniref:hypothetical protein n=1 Tax=Proteus sp. STS61-E TaxID=3237301 RepID=UPI0034C6B687